MGFLDKLGNSIAQGFKTGVTYGVNQAIYGALNNTIGRGDYVDGSAMDDWGNITRPDEYYLYDDLPDYYNDNEEPEDKLNNRSSSEKFKDKSKNIKQESDTWTIVNTDEESNLLFHFPNWNYANYINERALFQKSITSMANEPGYFYFKIFFRFDTQHGLFGGILNNEQFTNHQPAFTKSTNSAAKFLYNSRNVYKLDNPKGRISALEKFANILSYINTNAPWFFQAVRGLKDCNKPYIQEFQKERYIEIGTLPDAIDMRLSTLMSLYKFIVYDDINCKEIIPENLRKFDMQIVLFGMPIRYLQTSFKTNDNPSVQDATQYKSNNSSKFPYKTLNVSNANDMDNVMSFMSYTFKNCEFDLESWSEMIQDATNTDPFKIGESQYIKIKYDRVYTHMHNEFCGFMFGSDGFYYTQFSRFQKWLDNKGTKGATNDKGNRYKALRNMLDNPNAFDPKHPDRYKSIVDMSEAIIQHNGMKVSPYAMGNLYGESALIGSPYFLLKMRALKDGGAYADALRTMTMGLDNKDRTISNVRNQLAWDWNKWF